MEKEKRTKLDNKVERTIYLGMSPDHSDDTAKLLSLTVSLKTMQIIYRRNKCVLHREIFSSTQTQLQLQFLDDDMWWTIKDFGTHDGHQVLWYTNNETGHKNNHQLQKLENGTTVPNTQLNNATTHLTQASSCQ